MSGGQEAEQVWLANQAERKKQRDIRLSKLERVNKWRKEFGYEAHTSDWVLGRNETFKSKYTYEKDLYNYNVGARKNQQAAYAEEQRKRVRKTKVRQRAFGPTPRQRGATPQGNGGTVSNYRRVGKTSLIQRALQTGSSPSTGISVPK